MDLGYGGHCGSGYGSSHRRCCGSGGHGPGSANTGGGCGAGGNFGGGNCDGGGDDGGDDGGGGGGNYNDLGDYSGQQQSSYGSTRMKAMLQDALTVPRVVATGLVVDLVAKGLTNSRKWLRKTARSCQESCRLL